MISAAQVVALRIDILIPKRPDMPALSNLVNPTKIVAAVLFNTIMTRLFFFNFVLFYFMNYDSMMQRLWLSSSTVPVSYTHLTLPTKDGV